MQYEQNYTDYLSSHGERSDAEQYGDEMMRNRQIKRLIDGGMAASAINTTAAALPIYWGFGLILLSNLLVVVS